MRFAIHCLDRALKRLYELGLDYRAEDFLLRAPPETGAGSSVDNSDLQGALFIRAASAQPTELSVGIYLSEQVRRELSRFPQWRGAWSVRQLGAFSVAAEEVSHLHYLLYHASRGRQLSHLELEIQGEVDKFLLAFFSQLKQGTDGASLFDALFTQLFESFRFAETLSEEQRERYREASQLARRYLLKLGPELRESASREQAFRRLRRFYRLGSSEKISLIAA